MKYYLVYIKNGLPVKVLEFTSAIKRYEVFQYSMACLSDTAEYNSVHLVDMPEE